MKCSFLSISHSWNFCDFSISQSLTVFLNCPLNPHGENSDALFGVLTSAIFTTYICKRLSWQRMYANSLFFLQLYKPFAWYLTTSRWHFVFHFWTSILNQKSFMAMLCRIRKLINQQLETVKFILLNFPLLPFDATAFQIWEQFSL